MNYYHCYDYPECGDNGEYRVYGGIVDILGVAGEHGGGGVIAGCLGVAGEHGGGCVI